MMKYKPFMSSYNVVSKVTNVPIGVKVTEVAVSKLLNNIEYFTKFVKKLEHKRESAIPIITMDIEAYQEESLIEGTVSTQLVPCAIGYCTGTSTNTYVSDGENSKQMFYKAFDDLLCTENNGAVVYIHNLAKFDGIYLLHYLETAGFKVTSKFKNNRILLNMVVRRDGVKVTLIDSLQILPMALRSLAVAFDVTTRKTYFPYKFLNKENLQYIGPVPDKSL